MKTRLVVGFLLYFVCTPAFAVTLKQVQFSNGDQIDLLFDGKITKNQIRTEYFNDIVQLSLTDVSVYPAKISSINGNRISKIFAYQYAPKLVRCRLTVRGKAEGFKDLIQVNTSGKTISIRVGSLKADKLVVRAAHAMANAQGEGEDSAGKKSELKAESGAADTEEKALLEKVMKSTASEPVLQNSSSSHHLAPKGTNLTSGKPLQNPLMAFGKMIFVVSLFAIFAWGLKKFMNGKWGSAGTLGAVNRFARNKFGKKGKMIEVISTHYLGPKKSIVVVKIAGRLLVLGTANDSINLISQLSPGTPINGADFGFDDEENDSFEKISAGSGATSAGKAIFSDLLDGEKGKPAAISAASIALSTPRPLSLQSGLRAQIKSRIEGMKPL